MHSVIIGGTRGLGREVVRLFSSAGHAVSIVGRRPPPDRDRQLVGTRYWQVDLTTATDVDTIFNEVTARGPVNYLVFLQRFKGDGDPWVGELETSIGMTRIVIERLAPMFSPDGDKSIVLVGSIVSRFVSASQSVGYHVAKSAFQQIARYYAVTLGPQQIRVNCVSPSTFIKEENEEFYLTKSKALMDLFAEIIPLGRMGTARDAASVIGFLCSSAAAFITGQEFLVDGGVSLLSQEALARKLKNL